MSAILPQIPDAPKVLAAKKKVMFADFAEPAAIQVFSAVQISSEAEEQEPETWVRHKNFLRAIVARAYADLLQLPPSLWESWKQEILRREIDWQKEPVLKRKKILIQNLFVARTILRNARDAKAWLTSNSNSRWSYSWIMQILGQEEPEEIRALKNT